MQEGVGRQINQPHHQQSSGRLLEPVVPDGTAQDGMRRLDAVHASVLGRVAVRVALQVESGQEVEFARRLE